MFGSFASFFLLKKIYILAPDPMHHISNGSNYTEEMFVQCWM